MILLILCLLLKEKGNRKLDLWVAKDSGVTRRSDHAFWASRQSDQMCELYSYDFTFQIAALYEFDFFKQPMILYLIICKHCIDLVQKC